MEPLGWEFEESLFDSGSEIDTAAPSFPYTAKACAPKKALQEYSSCFLLLPSANTAMRRDVQESQARCLLRLGKHEEALGIAQKLMSRATNVDHLTAVLNLQVAIHAGQGMWQKAISCLQQLVSFHPFNPCNWKKLAEAYMSLAWTVSVSASSIQQAPGENFRNSADSLARFKECTASRYDKAEASVMERTCTAHSAEPNGRKASARSGDQSRGQDEAKPPAFDSRAQRNRKELETIACASFVRSRLLLQLMQSQQASFVLENNIKTQQEIEEKLKGFALQEDMLGLITEIMGEDLTPERMKEEVQVEGKCGGGTALAASMIASDAEFTDKWFRKTLDGFFHFTNSVGHRQALESRANWQPD
ncbi:uncharacterized protein C8orf76 homolog isoform X2 [Rhinatrema bivittatum]|uniref:uncharacterized protein C8orf76 homolog isoform X2 n=1 Tax=Rhinatrema bivittatum TaxID=194408 RepID=UPI00112EE014|nr:uncharacterized protein C8orf76 homolog isoform X2 [Rhinatrema bivittatum]